MPTAFLFGLITMLFSKNAILKDRTAIYSKPFCFFMTYMILVFVPVTGYFFYAYTGWSTVYLRPEFMIPFWAGPFIFFTYFLGGFLGASLGQILIQTYRTSQAWLLLFFGILWLAGIFALTYDEYFHLGTYTQYRASEAVSIFSDSGFMTKLNVMGPVLALPLVGIILYFRRNRAS